MDHNAALNDNVRRTNEVEPENSLSTPREEQSTPSAISVSRRNTRKSPKKGKTLLPMTGMVMPESPSSTLPLPRMVSLQSFWLNIMVGSTHTINKHYGEKRMPMIP